jgi:fructoselysine-6-P-deglycase FrlB-like protein
MTKRYALMLVTQAELLDEFDSEKDAEAALIRLIDADESLVDEAGVVELDRSGRPVGTPVMRHSLAPA